ncbi:MAG: YraN family protein, partial [Firmicutes bacterium]|nr:YraN family protein [Bacillota bacterium]
MPESQKRRLGDWGEDSACRYLKDRGWTLIERNFRCRFGEIDIIASKQGIL